MQLLSAIAILAGVTALCGWFDLFHAIAAIPALAAWFLFRRFLRNRREQDDDLAGEPELDLEGPTLSDRLRLAVLGAGQAALVALLTAGAAALLSVTPVYALCYDRDCESLRSQLDTLNLGNAHATGLELADRRLARPASRACRTFLEDRRARLHLELAGQSSGEAQKRHLDEALAQAERLANPDLVARIKAQIEVARQRAEIESLSRIHGQLQQTADGYLATLPDVLFESGAHRLVTEAAYVFDQLADALRRLPAGERIRIAGHADNTGQAESNQQLSLRRAEEVCQALVKRGFRADQFTVTGFGAGRPVASNDTPEGRKQNRRVEIFIAK
jgi:outer membrane protein OmpA-like peptidoglycan-associated protein